MGKVVGIGSSVVALLGLFSGCAVKTYEVGRGQAGDAGEAGDGASTSGQPGSGGSASDGTGGTGSMGDGGSDDIPGMGSGGSVSAGTGGGVNTGGTVSAGGTESIGTGGSAASSAGGTSSVPSPLGAAACASYLEGVEGPTTDDSEILWPRVSRVLMAEVVEMNPTFEGRAPSEMVKGTLDPISSLTAPSGLVRFIQSWAFDEVIDSDTAAPPWASRFFMHGGNLAGLFAPFGDEDEGRASFLSDPVLLKAFPKPSTRGLHMFERLFCQPRITPEPGGPTPLDPPPEGMTTRQYYETAVNEPTCHGCHALIDPLGFSLEHFDAAGDYREEDNGLPIDASGSYSQFGSFEFDGISELAPQLASSPEVATCVADYAIRFSIAMAFPENAPPGSAAERDFVLCKFAEGEYSGQKLIEAIVDTPAFRSAPIRD